MSCHFYSTIGAQVALIGPVFSSKPAACSSFIMNCCLTEDTSAWHAVWACPVNLIASAASAALEIVACAIMLVVAAIFAVKGAATEELSKRAEWLSDAKTMVEATCYTGILFGLTLVNGIYPAIKFYTIANNLYTMINKKPSSTQEPTPETSSSTQPPASQKLSTNAPVLRGRTTIHGVFDGR